MQTWTSVLPHIFSSFSSREYIVPDNIRPGTDTFMVPSPDRQDLHFSFPVVIKSGIANDLSLPLTSSAGAVHAIIEYCKKSSKKITDLGHLYGATTGNQSRYSINIEPCTISFSSSCIASNLWRPDDQNLCVPGGIRLSIRGAIPNCQITPANINIVRSVLETYVESIAHCVHNVPVGQVKRDWESVLDQQYLRSELQKMGLICFIGDGTRPARSYTRHRSWYRVAGPKDGVHIPFYCPECLSPVEIVLKGSNRTVTGLGIRKGEIFAITGSNAEGKSTLLQAILAGEDDHAPGDGRELLVTVPGGVSPDATNIELNGAYLRPFFDRIPPGMSGSPESAFGQGSGSASMAYRFSDALRLHSPYIVIDEDRAAQNLMIPCYMSSIHVHSLAVLLREGRDWLSGTSLIIAGSGMELLIGQADRIVRLSNHKGGGQSVAEYREGLLRHYEKVLDMFPKNGSGESNISK